MRISRMAPELARSLISGSPEAALELCHQCGQCASICPSFRHGGIDAREIIARALIGAIEPEAEGSIWLCAMCNSCSERCQLGVDPADVIVHLRNLSTQRGSCPEYFISEARLFLRTGMAFPITGMTKKLRGELGLDDLEVDEGTLGEVRAITERTGMRGLIDE